MLLKEKYRKCYQQNLLKVSNVNTHYAESFQCYIITGYIILFLSLTNTCEINVNVKTVLDAVYTIG